VTGFPSRAAPGSSIADVARLVEESTLGTPGARQLRDRAPAGMAEVIRARAFFERTQDGRDWWRANHGDAAALRRRASEVGAAGNAEICDLLLRLAELQDAATTLPGQPAGPAGPRAFADFYRQEIGPLTRLLCQNSGLPQDLGRKLISKAMVRAFDDWEQLAASADAGEWVLGFALQRYLELSRTQRADSEDAAWTLDGLTGHGSDPDPDLPPGAARRTGAHVAGALAVAASKVAVTGRSLPVTETLAADVALGPVQTEWDADRAVTALYSEHYRSLVRLAALLVRDVATAEEVVQDSFVAMHGGWRQLRDSDKALSYLRQSVVNRSRSALRHQVVVDRNAPKPSPGMPSAEHAAITVLERSAVVAALRALPPRQREALVLRYYGDLSDAQIAVAMGISKGAVKSHTARAMIALRHVLEREI